MTRQRYLDLAPARRLTSRELAAVLGSVIGVLTQEHTVETLRASVGLTFRMIAEDDIEASLHLMIDEAERHDPGVLRLSGILHGFCRGWRGLEKPGAMRAALRFYTERDDVWAEIASNAQLHTDLARRVSESVE